MRVLIVSRRKEQFPNHIAPFVLEQGKALAEAGCEVDFLPFNSPYWNSRPIIEKIKEFKPDIIHAHYGLCGIPSLLQHKVPVVITFHNGETLNPFVNFFSSLFSLHAEYVIYVAQHIYDKCVFKKKKSFCILPCGVNLDECVITPKEEARAKLGFERDKKYILFGGAFNNLRKNYPLLEEAIELTERKDIVILEMKGLSREQVCLHMSACDLFALPTKSEGSPQALKEAMACNCPIVATNVADIKHLLGTLPGHYLCGFDSKNMSESLNKAFIFNHKTEGRLRIVELGFSNDIIARRLISIYESTLH